MTNEQMALCDRIRRLGYAQNCQVRLYGEVFDLTSDPVSGGGDLIFVDALERRSGRMRRLRIPLNIVRMAEERPRAA
jgi:hypothetical protein